MCGEEQGRSERWIGRMRGSCGQGGNQIWGLRSCCEAWMRDCGVVGLGGWWWVWCGVVGVCCVVVRDRGRGWSVGGGRAGDGVAERRAGIDAN